MNLVEHCIEKVFSIEEVTEWEEYMKKANADFDKNNPMLEVKMLINCYGRIQEITKWFYKSEWEKIKEQGYYMD